ncbi:hypothetical protein ACTFIR_005971 [Dictyostelium discoideum]
MSKVYSKSQTVSPGKPQNIFVTALPSSVSAPSLLSLQKPNNGAGSHRKQRQNSGSSKNRPNLPVDQIKSTERKNSGNKSNNNKNRKYSKNNPNVNGNNINSSSIVIKCEEQQQQDGFLKSQEFPNLFKNKLYLKDDISPPSSSSSTSSPSCLSSSSSSTFSQSEIAENKDDINNNNNNNNCNNTNGNFEEEEEEEKNKVEQQPIEEETFIESSFEETKEVSEEVPFEEQFEILPISIGEETLKEYTSFLSVLSELIVDMYYDDDKSSTSSQSSSSAPSSPKPIKNNDNNTTTTATTTTTTTTSKTATSSLSTIEKFQVFNVDQIPEISIEDYIERVFKYLPFGTDIFIFSTIYLDRLIQWNQEIQISPLNIHRLFMASIIVASKFHNDKALNNRYYAQVGGISLFEMNQLEIHFLLLLNWKLHIDPEIFDAFKTSIQSKIDILDMKIRKLSNNGNINNESNKENIVIKTTEEKVKNSEIHINSNNNDCNNNNNNNATVTTTSTPTTITTPTPTPTTTTIPTPATQSNNNNCNNSTKRYVTLVETDKNNSKPKTKYNSSNKSTNNGGTSQFSRILNNRGSKNVSYHHPNYLTYPLAAPQTNYQPQQQQQQTYYQPPHHQQQYYQQQQYYSNYQYNQQLSYYQQQQQQQHYDDYYQQQQIPIPPQPQNYIYQQPYHSTSSTSSTNIYIGKSGTPSSPNMNDICGGVSESYDSQIPSSFGSSSGSGSVGSCTSSSIGSTTAGSASQYQPHSWQNAYYYGGVATSQFSYHTPTYQ